ncbi:MAG: YkgJ family cysteine cluster protein [Firmicutes bacterium]|nr:YkgJ family cysteine cluster protein [Bacillota bacterium]
MSFKQNISKKLDDGSLPGVDLNHKFNFMCHDDCMGTCCTNITIQLDPWDVELMSRHLNISGQDFVEEYCDVGFSNEMKWPYVTLKHAAKGPCAFMLEDGRCEVYPARSRNCRTYPIGRAVRFDEKGNKEERVFIVEKMSFCLGHNAEDEWTVEEWFNDSEAQKFYQMSDLYLELINYATTKLNSRVWMSQQIGQMIMPLLYGPDMLRKKLSISEEEVGHEEFYHRRLKAVKVILEDIAANFGFGPQTDVEAETFAGSVMDRVKEVLLSQ